MAEPVLTPELLDRYAEVVKAHGACDGDWLSEALANVWGIVGTAKILLAVVAERDEARRMLGECYILSGADTDGNAPDSPHLWAHAAEEVRRLREHYDELLIEGAQAEEAECAERARCVAHLRALADSDGRLGEEAIVVLLDAADEIEAGEHIPKRPRPTELPVVVVRREVADE